MISQNWNLKKRKKQNKEKQTHRYKEEISGYQMGSGLGAVWTGLRGSIVGWLIDGNKTFLGGSLWTACMSKYSDVHMKHIIKEQNFVQFCAPSSWVSVSLYGQSLRKVQIPIDRRIQNQSEVCPYIGRLPPQISIKINAYLIHTTWMRCLRSGWEKWQSNREEQEKSNMKCFSVKDLSNVGCADGSTGPCICEHF